MSVLNRAVRSEWTKLRSLPSTALSLLAVVGLTVFLSWVVAVSLDTSGSAPGCTPGSPGCGDEDVVMNGLSGVVLGQIAVVAVAVLAAKAFVVTGLCLLFGLSASVVAFLVSQPVLHGNGFVPEQGYPIVSLIDQPALRAVLGTGLYLALVALLSLGIGVIVRHTAAAITTVLGLLLVPFIVVLLLPESARELVQKYSPMTAGLAIQRTVDRVDSVPIGEWAGLGVLGGYALVAILVAFVSIRVRDA